MKSKYTLNRRKFVALTGSAAMGAVFAPGRALAQESQPKRGGHFKQALGGGSTSDSFEPGSMWDSAILNMSSQARETLVEILPDFTAGPALAESWEPSADAKEWRFNLRKGVEFHDGKTLTAEDVVYSINHHRGKDSISGAQQAVANVADVKADGPNVVVFTLHDGSADFPMDVSDHHLPIMKEGDKDWKNSIGTGPYALDDFEPGVRSRGRRFANYYRDDRGFFDEVETLVINDSVARMNALVGGQVHAINQVDAKTASLIKRDKRFNLQSVRGTKYCSLPMATDMDPYASNDVRLALKYGIDRKQIVDNILQGYGSVGNDHPIATANKYYNPDQKIREYDPERAQFHLKKANASDAVFSLHASTAAFAGAVDAAALFQESARNAGIKIDLVREPTDGYWKQVWKKKPFCMAFWSGRPTADAILSLAYGADSSSNDTRWKNERFNALLLAARSELDDAKRREMYYEIQAIVSDDSGTIVPAFLDYIQATSSQVATGVVSGSSDMDGFKSAVRWWFA